MSNPFTSISDATFWKISAKITNSAVKTYYISIDNHLITFSDNYDVSLCLYIYFNLNQNELNPPMFAPFGPEHNSCLSVLFKRHKASYTVSVLVTFGKAEESNVQCDEDSV